MSNIIKSGFVAFSDDNRLVIDSNGLFAASAPGKVIRSIEEQQDNLEDLQLEDIINDKELQDPDFEEKRTLADSMVEDARAQAEQILEDAKAQAQDVLSEAEKNGYKKGYEEGQQQARQEAGAQLSRDQEALNQQREQLIAEYNTQKEMFLYEAEPKMADVTIHLIQALIGIVVEEQKDVLVYLIDKAMRDIDDSMHFVIKVSGDDFELVSSRKDRIYGSNNPAIEIDVIADSKLVKNQCLIETDNGIVNCSLDEQLINLARDIRMLAVAE